MRLPCCARESPTELRRRVVNVVADDRRVFAAVTLIARRTRDVATEM